MGGGVLQGSDWLLAGRWRGSNSSWGPLSSGHSASPPCWVLSWGLLRAGWEWGPWDQTEDWWPAGLLPGLTHWEDPAIPRG